MCSINNFSHICLNLKQNRSCDIFRKVWLISWYTVLYYNLLIFVYLAILLLNSSFYQFIGFSIIGNNQMFLLEGTQYFWLNFVIPCSNCCCISQIVISLFIIICLIKNGFVFIQKQNMKLKAISYLCMNFIWDLR